jgi:hypothetical protein
VDSIFLIHGFLGTKFSYYRHILEDWVSTLAKTSSTSVTAHVFRFDASSIPLEGKDALEREVWRLRRFLVLLLHESARRQSLELDIPVSEHSDDLSFQHDASSTDRLQPIQPNRNTILFIAHGLGSWIVKDVLAHPSSGNIAYTYGRTEVKFVDLDIDKGIENTYDQYLMRNWTTFNVSVPKPRSGVEREGLISYLREIDENFDAFANMYNATGDSNEHSTTERTSQTIYRGHDLAIWMSDNRLTDPREVCFFTEIAVSC